MTNQCVEKEINVSLQDSGGAHLTKTSHHLLDE